LRKRGLLPVSTVLTPFCYSICKVMVMRLQPFRKTLSHAFSTHRKIPKIMKIHENSRKFMKKKKIQNTLHTTTTLFFSNTNHTHSFNLYSTVFIMRPKARKKAQTETHGGDDHLSDDDTVSHRKLKVLQMEILPLKMRSGPSLHVSCSSHRAKVPIQ